MASTGKFAAAGNMTATREEHAAVLLANGNVLASGGNNKTLTTQTPLASAELYNPTTGTWTATGSMNSVRVGHTSTLLQNGKDLPLPVQLLWSRYCPPQSHLSRPSGEVVHREVCTHHHCSEKENRPSERVV
mgnify:CR=1 FL=1